MLCNHTQLAVQQEILFKSNQPMGSDYSQQSCLPRYAQLGFPALFTLEATSELDIISCITLPRVGTGISI